jgi:hypothetical protein
MLAKSTLFLKRTTSGDVALSVAFNKPKTSTAQDKRFLPAFSCFTFDFVADRRLFAFFL